MILIILIMMILTTFIYLNIPYSPVKKEYWNTVKEYLNEYRLTTHNIIENDLKGLPETLQQYFIKNGYVGIESASAVVFNFENVNFSMGINKPKVKIHYTVYDFVKDPVRLALIDSKFYVIPFEGIDTCKDAKGNMKGVIGKHIPIFNETFDIIDSSYLAECLMHPSLALQENISYKEIDKYSVEAIIKKNGIETTGIFYFNEAYEMTKFVVEKRLNSETNTYEKWSAVVEDYRVIEGLNRPTKFQAIWNFRSGDLVYFDSNNMKITYK